MKYQTTLLEDWIKEFYFNIDIFYPYQLDMLSIANRLGIVVHFEEITSRVYNSEIIIDSRLSPAEQWQDFAHELCHVLRQDGNQLIMVHKQFLDFQEAKAENFSLHFCVPTFMLFRYRIPNIPEGISFVMEKFKVTREFATKRLIHFRNQLQFSKAYHEFQIYVDSICSESVSLNWSKAN